MLKLQLIQETGRADLGTFYAITRGVQIVHRFTRGETMAEILATYRAAKVKP